MNIGIINESSKIENRAGLTPSSVSLLAGKGHKIYVQASLVKADQILFGFHHLVVAKKPIVQEPLKKKVTMIASNYNLERMTKVLSNRVTPYLLEIGEKGIEDLLAENPTLAEGAYVHKGKLAKRNIAERFGLNSKEP